LHQRAKIFHLNERGQPSYLFLAMIFFALFWAGPLLAYNGFDLKGSLIPVAEIKKGGPPKDGIPALVNPRMIPASQAKLGAKELVVGVKIGKHQRAYPIKILIWHENINDTIGKKPIAVTYCPLCNSVFVFDRFVGGEKREFGISGLLWNSNVLLFDRQSSQKKESLWSQVDMRAVTGPASRKGLKITSRRSRELKTWSAPKGRHLMI
jgi:hypothetical protein